MLRAVNRWRDPADDVERLAVGARDRITLREKHEPVGAGFLIEFELVGRKPVVVRRSKRGDLQRGGVAPSFGREFLQFGNIALEGFRLANDGAPSVVRAYNPLAPLRSMRTEHNRGSALLYRLGIASDGRKFHEFAVVAGLRFGPQNAQSFHRFTQSSPAHTELCPHRFGLLLEPPAADSEHDAATRNNVETRDHFRGHKRLALGQLPTAGWDRLEADRNDGMLRNEERFVTEVFDFTRNCSDVAGLRRGGDHDTDVHKGLLALSGFAHTYPLMPAAANANDMANRCRDR